jgi:hypothetical protein
MLQHEAFTLMESHLLCTLMHPLITKIIYIALAAQHELVKPALL